MARPLVAAALIALGVALGIILAVATPEPNEQSSIEWLDSPRSLDSFSLQSAAGPFDGQSLLGRWTIILFGFLNCPDICPTSMAEFARLADSLQSTPVNHAVGFVFISIAPGRDSVSAVSEYAQHFSPALLGVGGASEQLQQLAGDLGMAFKVAADEDSYTVTHPAIFSIVDPNGRLRGRFRPGFDRPELTRNLVAKVAVTDH
ncbi:MAG: SCO family protein [Pseudomonadales bacterium]